MPKPKLDPAHVERLRRSTIKLIHVAKRQLGVDDDNYRTILHAATGKTSCKDMSLPELNRAMDSFRKLGFTPTSSEPKRGKKLSPRTRHKQPISKTQIDKIRALWITAYQEGVVSSRYEDGPGGLNQFVRRMTQVDRIDWLKSPYQANKVIEGLKAMLRRAGVEVESGRPHP